MTGSQTKALEQKAEALIAAFNASDWTQFKAAYVIESQPNYTS